MKLINMAVKRLFPILSIVLISAMNCIAQSEISIEERLGKLEVQIARQNTKISELESELKSVIKQNLALKNALSLTPTISEFKTDELYYKLHEAVGDSVSGTVNVFMTVTNTTPEDIDHYQWETVNFMDENGVQNKAFNDYEVKVGLKNSAFSINSLYSDSPTQLTIKLLNVDPHSQYIKILEGKVYKETKLSSKGLEEFKRSFIMRNIPINWK